MTAMHAFDTDTAEREIVVQRLEVAKSGVTKTGPTAGRAWHLFAVYANELDGTPIDAPMRSFEDLAGVVRVSFEPTRNRDGVITHLTLKRAGVDAIHARWSKARAAVMGEPTATANVAPHPANDRPAPTLDEFLALKSEVATLKGDLEQLRGRFALFQSFFPNDQGAS